LSKVYYPQLLTHQQFIISQMPLATALNISNKSNEKTKTKNTYKIGID